MNSLDFSIVWQALPYLLHGLAFSLQLTVFAFLTAWGSASCWRSCGT